MTNAFGVEHLAKALGSSELDRALTLHLRVHGSAGPVPQELKDAYRSAVHDAVARHGVENVAHHLGYRPNGHVAPRALARPAYAKSRVHKADKRTKEAGAVAGTAVAANEGRVFLNHRQHGSLGTAISAQPYKGKIRDRRGISDAPLGAKFSQASHPEGVYNISTHSLIGARRIPARRRGQDQLRESIRSKGMDRPVHMRIWQDGNAEIWDGKHRAARAQEAGLKKVPVSVSHEKGNRPKPTSLIEVRNRIQDANYRKHLTQAAGLVKRGDTMISAFGIEHLEKGIAGTLETGVKAFKSGITGAVKAPKPTAAGGGAFKAGKFMRTNAKPLAIGGGVGLGAGALAGSRKNY